MEKPASSFDSANEQSRVSWGKFVRAQQLGSQRSCLSSPDLEYVTIQKAPLPSPAVLMDYDLAVPGTADRIVSLLEQEVLHQRAIEIKQVEAEIAGARTKELFRSITSLVAVVGGFMLLWYGKNLEGAIAFIITLAQLVGTSVAGRIRRAKANQSNASVSLPLSTD